MKHILLLAAFALVLTSCKKSKHQSSSADQDLTGNWKLVLITGGIAGIHETAAQWGHTDNYTFRSDATFTHTLDGASTNYPAYTLTPDAVHGGNNLSVAGEYQFSVVFAHDTLVMSNINISDATSGWYVRQ